MGIKISTLKRAKYLIVALALVLTSAPFVLPSGSAFAEQLYDCVNSASELSSRFGRTSQTRTASLCSKIENYDWWNRKQTITAYGNSTLDLNGNTIESNFTTSSRSQFSSAGTLTIVGEGLVDGTLSTGNGGKLIIRGGTYTSNPTNYVDTEGGYQAYNVGDNRWTVARATEVEAYDVVAPVGTDAVLFTVSPAEVNEPRYTIRDETGAPAQNVRIFENTEDGVITGTVVGENAGEYTFNISSNGKSDSSSVKFYEYDDIDDQVIFVQDGADGVIDVARIFHVEGIDYTVTSGDGTVATVSGTEITGVASGTTVITITLADSLSTEVTFNLKVYDFYADEDAFLVKKGGELTIRPDSKWEATLDDNYDHDIVTVTGEDNTFTIAGNAVGEAELTFTLEGREKTVKVYVYDINSTELWVAKGESAEVDAEIPGEQYSIAAVSSDPYVAEFTGTDYLNINGLNAGDATITYSVTLGEQTVSFDVTVHVYEIEVEHEIYLISGATVDVNDPAVATVKNGEAISVRFGAGSGVTTLDGETAADGVITAGETAGSDMYCFYAGEEQIGTIFVNVFTVEELEDKLLSVSGRGADEFARVTVDGENLPEYTLASSDENVASISDDYVNAEGAGDATITVTFDAYGAPTAEFNVKVSDFTSDARRSYDLAEGSVPVIFTVSEKYDQDMISCKVNGADCDESDVFDVIRDENGMTTVDVKEGARGGDYRLTFTDEMISRNNTVNVDITVREIVIDETEYYLEAGENTIVDVDTRGGSMFDRISARVVSADGGSASDATATCLLGYCTLGARRAGQYVVEIRDTNFWGTEVYATKYVTLYVFDFNVEDAEYHVVKGDTGMHLVTALNEYWEKTNAEGVTGVAVWQKPGSSSEYAFVLDADTEAGDYGLKFYAYGGPDMEVVRDTKEVTVHVYEMVAPEQTTYYGQVGDSFTVDVHDKNVLGRVTNDYAGRGLRIRGNTVTANQAGEYTVTYTDRMNRGRGGEVGTYTATFVIYEVQTETIYVAAGDEKEISSHTDWDADLATDDGAELTVEDGKVKFATDDTTELGVHEVEISHIFPDDVTRVVKRASVIVYKVTPDEETDPTAVTEETIKDLFEKLNDALTEDDWDAFLEKAQAMFGNDLDAILAYLQLLGNVEAGNEINTEVVVTDINDSVSEEDVAAIEAALEGTDYDHIDYYDISVIMSVDGDPFGKLHQLDGSIVVALAKAEDPATGYTRQYFVIAKHGDSEEAVMLVEGTDFYILDGQIYVISDKFSTFAVAYKDTLKPKAPDTGFATRGEAAVGGAGDDVSVNMLVGVMASAVAVVAVLSLAGAVELAKRK